MKPKSLVQQFAPGDLIVYGVYDKPYDLTHSDTSIYILINRSKLWVENDDYERWDYLRMTLNNGELQFRKGGVFSRDASISHIFGID